MHHTSRLATLLGLVVAIGLTTLAATVPLAHLAGGDPPDAPAVPVDPRASPSSGIVLGPEAAPPRKATLRDAEYAADLPEAPTADKAQSKLWFAHGAWWGVLLDGASGAFRIHRLAWATQAWEDTGVLVDERADSQADALVIGDAVYVVSAGANAYRGDAARVMRYRWDAAGGRYVLDPGFPVEITDRGVTTITIARDTTGRLWTTYIRDKRLFVNRTSGEDTAWGEPFAVPGIDDPSASRAAVIAAGGRIHVLWTSGSEDAVLQAIHEDGRPDLDWQTTTALVEGVRNADDHLNVKAAEIDGEVRLYAAIKTSFDLAPDPNPNAPQVLLLEILPDGTVRSHLVGRVRDRHTRPIVLIDADRQEVYVLATSPFGGGEVYFKRSPLDAIAFTPGKGTALIGSPLDPAINDVTSTKQNLTAETGLLAVASDRTTRRYLHGVIDLGGPRWDPPTDIGDPPASPTPAPAGDG